MVPPKGVRLSEKVQLTKHSVMKFDRGNKFYLYYNGQKNSLRIKLNIAWKWAL